MKKALAMIMAIACCRLTLAGCGSKETTGNNDGSQSAVKTAPLVDINNGAEAKIAYIPMSTGQEDYSVIVGGMQEALTLYPNVSFQTYDAGFNPTNQIDLINECVTQGVKVIIINSMDSTALNSTIASAEAAGVSVITLNNGATGAHSFHIMNSDYDSGWAAAEYLDKLCGSDANVVILDVNATLKQTCRMGTAFEDYIAKTGHMNKLEDVNLDMTMVEDGYNATAQMLTKYSDIDIIYAVNDNCAIGAAQAIKAAGRDKDGIIVFGFSGIPSALDAIAKGEIYGTSYCDPYYEGYAAMVTALTYLQTGATAPSQNIDFVPTVELPTKIVTKDNVLDVIKTTHWDMSGYNY
jgi:ABC-type sugar transport system substrate-binding protein